MNMADVLSKLKACGIKLTPQRQEVIKVFLEDRKHFSADDVLKKVQQTFASVSFDTIYRTLNLFKELGLIIEVDFFDGCRRFEINDEENHHHHLVCLKCGKAEEVHNCPADCIHNVLKQNPGFKISGHTFNIYGYCPDCQ